MNKRRMNIFLFKMLEFHITQMGYFLMIRVLILNIAKPIYF